MLPPSVIVIRVIGYKVIYNKKSRGGTLGTYRFDHGCPRWAPPPLVEMVEVITADPPPLVERVQMVKSLQQMAITSSGGNGGSHYSKWPTPSGGNGGSHYSWWPPPPLVEIVEAITADGPHLLWWNWLKSLQQMAPSPLVEMVEVITADGPHLLWWKWWKWWKSLQ